MLDIDLLRKNECQPLTQEQMNNIKSQFHPSNTANVNIENVQIYSPVERKIGYWQEYRTVEGQQVLMQKPVYQKVLIVNNPSYDWSGNDITTYFDDASIVSNLSLFEYKLYSNSRFAPINAFYNAANDRCVIYLMNETVSNHYVLYLYYNSEITRADLVLRYTKTTDEWTPI